MFQVSCESVCRALRRLCQCYNGPLPPSVCIPLDFAVSQTDFSVARRLLSVDVGYQTATLDGKAEVKVPESPAVGWQFILPTDHCKGGYCLAIFPSALMQESAPCFSTNSASSLVYKHRVFPGPLPSDGFPQFSAPYFSPVPSSLRPAAYTVYHGHAMVGSEEPSPVELGESCRRGSMCLCVLVSSNMWTCPPKGSPERLPNDNMSSEAADSSKQIEPIESES